VPEEITVLHRVSRIVSSELSLDEMLGEIVGLTSQISGCDACLVYLVELPTEEFVLRASQVPHAADLGTLRMKIGEGVTGWVAEHQSPVALSSNAAADSRTNLPGSEAQNSKIPEAAGWLTVDGRAERLRGIVDHRDPSRLRAGNDRLYISRIAEEMGNDDRFGIAGYCCIDRFVCQI